MQERNIVQWLNGQSREGEKTHNNGGEKEKNKGEWLLSRIVKSGTEESDRSNRKREREDVQWRSE